MKVIYSRIMLRQRKGNEDCVDPLIRNGRTHVFNSKMILWRKATRKITSSRNKKYVLSSLCQA